MSSGGRDDDRETPVEGEARPEDTGRYRMSMFDAFERNRAAFSDLIQNLDALATFVASEATKVPSGRRPVVMVVEDNEALRRAYYRTISDDWDVIQTSSVDEALAAIESNSIIDCVILDIALPDGSGVDVAAHLRKEKFPKVPVIVVSAYLSAQIESILRKMGGPFTFLDKGVAEVKAAVKRAVTPGHGIEMVVDPAMDPEGKEKP